MLSCDEAEELLVASSFAPVGIVGDYFRAHDGEAVELLLDGVEL